MPKEGNAVSKTSTLRIPRLALAVLAVTGLGAAAGSEALAQVQAPRPPAPAAAPTADPVRPFQPLPQITFEEIMGMDARQVRWNPYAMGLGAIGGVVGYNVLAPTLFPMSHAAGGPLAGTLLADTAISASRLYAVSSAVAGAFVGQWLYDYFSDR
jgi:hypothetical protein